MKRIFLSFFSVVLVGFGGQPTLADNGSDDITAAQLVNKLLILSEQLKGVNSDCVLKVVASSEAKEFASISLLDQKLKNKVTLKLASSSDIIPAISSAGSGVLMESFANPQFKLVISRSTDQLRQGLSLKVGNDEIALCEFHGSAKE